MSKEKLSNQQVEEVRNKLLDLTDDELLKVMENTAILMEQRINKLEENEETLNPGVRSLIGFIKLTKTDKKIQEKLGDFDGSDLDKFINIGKESGFMFNEDDINELNNRISCEDDELENVAGGFLTIGVGIAIFSVAFLCGVEIALIKELVTELKK